MLNPKPILSLLISMVHSRPGLIFEVRGSLGSSALSAAHFLVVECVGEMLIFVLFADATAAAAAADAVVVESISTKRRQKGEKKKRQNNIIKEKVLLKNKG